MVKLIIFDKDGVILDLEATWLPVARAVADYTAELLSSEYDCPVDSALLLWEIGVKEPQGKIDPNGIFAAGSFSDIQKCWQKMFPEGSICLESDKNYQNNIKRLVASHSRKKSVARGNVVEPLRELHRRGYVLALLTNDVEHSARQSLDELGLLDIFCTIVGADSGFGAKPDKEGLLECCRKANVSPDECIMVGDTVVDYYAAMAAGAAGFVAVSNDLRFRPHKNIDRGNVIPHIEKLPKLLSEGAYGTEWRLKQ